MSKQVVHLLLIKGAKLVDEKGNIANIHQRSKHIYNTLEWKNLLKCVVSMGFTSFEVEKVTEEKEGGFFTIDTPEVIIDELKAVFNPEVKVELTPEQRRIAELEAKLEMLMSGKTMQVDNEEDEEVTALKEARKRYEALAGKKGSPKWTVEDINEKIAELEAAK